MTLEELIVEGRKISRPAWILNPGEMQQALAYWYEFDPEVVEETGERLWMVVDAKLAYPDLTIPAPYLGIITSEEERKGDVRFMFELPAGGVPLGGKLCQPLPPLEALFVCGGERVQHWLERNHWAKCQRYSEGFPSQELAESYITSWASEWPLYQCRTAYAILDGWHHPGPDQDWFELIDSRLLAWTLRDAEPWVEAWLLPSGRFQVIQRIT